MVRFLLELSVCRVLLQRLCDTVCSWTSSLAAPASSRTHPFLHPFCCFVDVHRSSGSKSTRTTTPVSASVCSDKQGTHELLLSVVCCSLVDSAVWLTWLCFVWVHRSGQLAVKAKDTQKLKNSKHSLACGLALLVCVAANPRLSSAFVVFRAEQTAAAAHQAAKDVAQQHGNNLTATILAICACGSDVRELC
jgi:hypothetical protein